MGAIRVLPPTLVSQIAAGEVVERPASVAKELIENALDAGAAAIEVEVVAGGKELVRVADDGAGMAVEDLRLAFARHATSKIATFDDLLGVASLGFRGEALASIAAVSRVELTSAASAGEGWRIRVAGGEVEGEEPAARPRGTTVEVASLFWNVPARRKFLKTDPTELRRLLEVVQGYALARPEIRFRLVHQDRVLLDLAAAGTGAGAVRRRIGQIFGAGLVDSASEIALAEGPVRVTGLVGDRSTTKGRRYFVFVNGRLVADRAVLASFYRAVRETWKAQEFPALFLYLDLPGEAVDVNVHPQKAEVRFRDARVLHLVFKAVRGALERGRGEGEAPLAAVGAIEGAGAWQGAGGRYPRPLGRADALGEPAAAGWPGKLAETAYAPVARAPVPLSGARREERTYRLLGQYKGTLILLEGPDGLYLVDQHVAHERILYERLRGALEQDRVRSQRLVEPVLLELGPAETLRLEGWLVQLAECGFELARLSAGTLAVAAVPAALAGADAEDLLESLAREDPSDAEAGSVRGRLLDALAASMACRAAIKMHEPQSADAMEAVVAELFAAREPWSCPHGRPTILKMSDRDLELRFGRR